MPTTTTTTAMQPAGVQLVSAHNLLAELDSLNAQQAAWMRQQGQIADAIDFIEAHGFTVRPRHCYCYADSPHAQRIAQIECLLGV